MTTLEHRDWTVQIGNVLITPGSAGRTLTVEFEVTKTTDREPNKCTLKVANLAPGRRAALQDLDDPQIHITAGYRGLRDTIFAGDARDVWSYRDGVDTWTEVESEDGGRAYRTARVERSFAPGTSIAAVIEACAAAMAVGIGNTRSVAADAELDSGGNNYATGTTVSGLAWRQLNRVCQSASLRWSVQNGDLQLRAAGRPAQVRAVLLSAGTGLLESPTRGKRDERTNKVTYGAKCLMIPGLYPGRVVRLRSREINADLMIKRVRYNGSTTGPDWFADLELQEFTT